MHPALIQAALKMRGVTQADIAAQCGHVSTTAVYQVIQGRSRSNRIELRIAAILQLPLAKLWPQWHGPDRKRRTLTAAETAKAFDAAVGQ